MTSPAAPPPSWNCDPTPVRTEREIDGLLRAAANLAPLVLPTAIGEEIRLVLWAYYNTARAENLRVLARLIIARRRGGDG